MVEQNHIQNPAAFKDTCALRISLALNALGGDFTITKDGHNNLLFGSGDWNNDSNKEWYLYKAADMQTYLTSEFGNAVEVNGTSGIPQGAEGFVYFEDFVGTDRRYDHIDYWDGNTVLGGYDYSSADEVKVYFIRTN
ncbi:MULTISPECIES: T6SS effector amidase Tae4 family protein [Sphingobacterium]|uniref:T6SS effector amidase Tae4 family protein n=1 Tax=Sphingobacterium TaxID=28453 RepID=UPI0013DCA85D|nr:MULTISPECIES: T6SS effector amidase Tae4 family protein [unclassified Sphingobacterium]